MSVGNASGSFEYPGSQDLSFHACEWDKMGDEIAVLGEKSMGKGLCRASLPLFYGVPRGCCLHIE